MWRCAGISVLFLAACEPKDDAAGDDGTATTGDTAECTPLAPGYEDCSGMISRTAAAACEPTAELAACDLPDAEEWVGDCITDEHCFDGARCFATGAIDICICERPCVVDADCGDGRICLCGAATGGRNACIEATCTTAADCSDARCDVSKDGCGQYGSAHTACRTALDECQSDADCPAHDFCHAEDDGTWRCLGGVCD